MKKIFFVAFLLFQLCMYPQSSRWTDYFSYFNILNIQKTGNSLFCATENGAFYYNEKTGEIKKLSKANGLHDIKITASSYNSSTDSFIVGYDTGKLDIITKDNIQLVVDIPFEQNYQGSKKVNYIYSEGDIAVISLDFGITIFDLKRLEFKETCYFKQGANYFKVNKAIIFNNQIFAASTNGIYSHPINNLVPNFAAWAAYRAGVPFQHINKNDTTMLISTQGVVTKSSDGINWQSIGSYTNLKDIVFTGGNTLLVQEKTIHILNQNLAVLNSVAFDEQLNTGYYSNGVLYGGSALSGLMKNGYSIAPDGPYSNTSYSLSIIDNQLWIAPGGRDNNYNAPKSTTLGYYHFNGSKWNHIKYQDINNETYPMKIIPNPSNLNENYVLSYGRGLIKMENQKHSITYNRNNSAYLLYERLTGGGYDKNGNLITIQTFASEVAPDVNNAIIIKTPDNIFKFLSLLPKRIILAGGAMDCYIDADGYIWVPSPRGNALTVYKYANTPLNTSDDALYLIDNKEGSGNLPSNSVLCVTVDNSGTAWIGTDNGLRIFRNPYPSLESGNYNTEPILIVESGLGEEVLRGVKITAIAVDGANRKWIGTYNSGVFYLSENGTSSLNKFTVDNSALPSNIITDIKVSKTGEVYFVTPLGVVSYRGDIIEAGDEFKDIVAYPNPVKPGYTGNITIRGLADNAYVKITDVAGNLVFETRAAGGIATWSGNNFNNKPVASGVYLVLMTNADGSKKATAKIAIIR